MSERPQPRPEYGKLALAIVAARRCAEKIAVESPSREISLVITKLDEAGLWTMWQNHKPE